MKLQWRASWAITAFYEKGHSSLSVDITRIKTVDKIASVRAGGGLSMSIWPSEGLLYKLGDFLLFWIEEQCLTTDLA